MGSISFDLCHSIMQSSSAVLCTRESQFEYTTLRPSHQTLERCPSGWGKGLRCCPTLRFFIKHICQNKLDHERSLLAKHEAVRPTKYLVWQRNGSKNGVPSFDYLRLVADDYIASAVFFHCL